MKSTVSSSVSRSLLIAFALYKKGEKDIHNVEDHWYYRIHGLLDVC